METIYCIVCFAELKSSSDFFKQISSMLLLSVCLPAFLHICRFLKKDRAQVSFFRYSVQSSTSGNLIRTDTVSKSIDSLVSFMKFHQDMLHSMVSVLRSLPLPITEKALYKVPLTCNTRFSFHNKNSSAEYSTFQGCADRFLVSAARQGRSETLAAGEGSSRWWAKTQNLEVSHVQTCHIVLYGGRHSEHPRSSSPWQIRHLSIVRHTNYAHPSGKLHLHLKQLACSSRMLFPANLYNWYLSEVTPKWMLNLGVVSYALYEHSTC